MTRRKRPGKVGVLAALRAAIKSAGGNHLAKSRFLATSGLKTNDIDDYFATWNDALHAVGLHTMPYNQPIADDTLLADWAAVTRKLKHPPSATEYHRLGKYGVATITRRFRGWKTVRAAFRAFATRHPQWKDVIPLIPPPSKDTLRRRGLALRPGSGMAIQKHRPRFKRTFAPLGNGRPVRGEHLGVGCMRYAPVNEMGVVGLFVMLAGQLGFEIEALQSGFPDCEASRRVGTAFRQTVRIEFEFESRKYRDHGHPLDGCDIIVCWVHNWEECPEHIEVIELSEVVKRLEDKL